MPDNIIPGSVFFVMPGGDPASLLLRHPGPRAGICANGIAGRGPQ